MTEIQQNRYDQLVRRVANVVGGGSQVNDTLNELFPTIDVENVPIELFALMGTTVATAGSLLVISAGDINKHQLFNPPDSGALLVLTTAILNCSVATRFELQLTAAALADDVGNVVGRDTRKAAATDIVGQNRSEQSPAGTAPIVQIRVEQNVSFTLQDPDGLFVIFPGFGVTAAPVTAAQQSLVQFFWRERAFEPAENNF